MEDKSNNQQKMEDINKNNVFVSADDIKTEAEAFEIAHKVEQEWAEEGMEVEYGIRIIK